MEAYYDTFLRLLRQELVPAMGCTEPIAVAYAAAIAREQLGELPETVKIAVSGNILKNVKSVVVPNTGGLRGLKAAAAAGIVAGRADRELEVISQVTQGQRDRIQSFLRETAFTVQEADSGYIFDIRIALQGKRHHASCAIAGFHTNVIRIEKDGDVLLDRPYVENGDNTSIDRSVLSVERIVSFAEQVRISDVKKLLDRQIEYNMAIAEAGLRDNYGSRIGQILLQAYGDAVNIRAKAYSAAGSDARMNGCELPVVINSGSGNQGITASVPVIIYGRELQVSQERLYRALVVSNLVTIHLKTGIGPLSAYCGATSAGCGAAAGIAFLYGGGGDQIGHAVVNAVAINSGMICDGAKSSCAAKIASAVEAGLLGVHMAFRDSEFVGGDGIVAKGVENTIQNVGRLARKGMCHTDREIIQMMLC